MNVLIKLILKDEGLSYFKAFQAAHMESEKYILAFNEIDGTDLNSVGGKGANLGELVRLGAAVPPGVCITTAAYDEFLKSNDLSEYIYSELDRVKADDLSPVKVVAERIQDKIRQTEIHNGVVIDILHAWQELGENNFFAVRSSATAEDLPEASFAGQHDSYLNVHGQRQILEKVRDCWASLFNERAIIYRLKNAVDHRRVKLAVVLQKMVFSDTAGIVFTADPVNGKRTTILINASFGLGEALVGGLVDPDTYRIDKKNWSIVERRTGSKRIAIRPLKQPGGGTYQERLGDDLGRAEVLRDEQIVELAKLAQAIEVHYGGVPQDIEWAIENRKLFIVQSRPITGLYPAPPNPFDPKNPRIYFSFNYFQMMTDPISPLGQSFIKMALFSQSGGRDPDKNSYIVTAGGRLFMDLTELLAFETFRKILPKFASRMLDPIIGQELEVVIGREEFRIRKSLKTSIALFKAALIAAAVAVRVIGNIFISDAQQRKAKMIRAMESNMAENKHWLESIDNLSRKLGACRILVRRTTPTMRRIFIANLASGILPFKILEAKLSGKGLDYEIAQIGRGLEGNIVMEMDLVIGDLADVLLENQELREYLADNSSLAALEGIVKIAGGAEFELLLAGFFKKFGFRGQSEIDLSRERYRENKNSILKLIFDTLQGKRLRDHRQKQKELAQAAHEAGQKIIAAVSRESWGGLKAWAVRHSLRAVRQYLPLREHPKYYLMHNLWLIKQVVLEAAAELTRRQCIERPEDIFYLTFCEVKERLASGRSAADLIRQRKQAYAGYRSLKLPRIITSEGEIIRAERPNEGFPEGSILGVSVSAGTVIGRAKVIIDPAKETLSKGEIMVARFTDPGWTPLFINAAGLVMEVGGIMTHGSIIAREYGLPAVVGVEDATKLIRTGQLIRVNGDQGFIEIMEK